MPFNVVHNAIYADDGVSGMLPSKEVQSNIYEDKVAVRTRLAFARMTRQNHAEHLKTIEACGCDTPYNKPYRPLGSMDSVLNLRIKKTKAYQKPVSLKGHRRLANATSHFRSLVSCPESSSEGDGEASEKSFTEATKNDDRSLASKLAFLRASARDEEQRSSSYHTIQKAVFAANERLRRVKGGTAFSTVVKTHGPLEGALWASLNECDSSKWLHESLRGGEGASGHNVQLAIELPEDVHQTRFSSVATLKQELEKLESTWLPKARKCSSKREGSRRKRSSLDEIDQEPRKHKITSEKQPVSNKERKSVVNRSYDHDNRIRKSSRIPAYMCYSSTNKSKIKEKIEAIRLELQPKPNADQNEDKASVHKDRRRSANVQGGGDNIDARTGAMAHKIFSASRQILKVQSSAASELSRSFNRTEFERPLRARFKFQAWRTELAENGHASHGLGMSSDVGLERLRENAQYLRQAEYIQNLRAQPWFERMLHYTRETFGDVLPVQEKLFRALRQIVVEGYLLDEALFKGLVLKAFSKVELRSPELQHVLAYVQDKVVGMSREDYRDFLVLHKLPIPNSLTEQMSASKTSVGESVERSARFQVGASMKAAAAIAKFKSRYRKRKRKKRQGNDRGGNQDYIPTSLEKNDVFR